MGWARLVQGNRAAGSSSCLMLGAEGRWKQLLQGWACRPLLWVLCVRYLQTDKVTSLGCVSLVPLKEHLLLVQLVFWRKDINCHMKITTAFTVKFLSGTLPRSLRSVCKWDTAQAGKACLSGGNSIHKLLWIPFLFSWLPRSTEPHLLLRWGCNVLLRIGYLKIID